MTDNERDAFERLTSQQELFDLGKPARPVSTRDYVALSMLLTGLIVMVSCVVAGLAVDPVNPWAMLFGVSFFLVAVIVAAFVARPRN